MPDVIVGTNAYIDTTDADAYFDERLYSTAWSNAADDDKARALIQATKSIDRQLLKGCKRLTDQALAFPRCYAVDQRAVGNLNYIGNIELVYDGSLWCETEVPQTVIDACCEEALALLDRGNSTRRKLQQEGVTGFGVSKISEQFTPGAGKGLVSQEARELLKPYLAGSVNIT